MLELRCSVQEPYKQAILDFIRPLLQPAPRVPIFLEFLSYSSSPSSFLRSKTYTESEMIAKSTSPLSLPTSYSTPSSSPSQAHLLFLNDSRTRVKVVLGEISSVIQSTSGTSPSISESSASTTQPQIPPCNTPVVLQIPLAYTENSNPSVGPNSSNSLPTENTGVQHSYVSGEEENTKKSYCISYSIADDEKDSNFVNYNSNVNEKSQNVTISYMVYNDKNDVSQDMEDTSDDEPEMLSENVKATPQGYNQQNHKDNASLDVSEDDQPQSTARTLPQTQTNYNQSTNNIDDSLDISDDMPNIHESPIQGSVSSPSVGMSQNYNPNSVKHDDSLDVSDDLPDDTSFSQKNFPKSSSLSQNYNPNSTLKNVASLDDTSHPVIPEDTNSHPYSFNYHFDQEKIEKSTRAKEKETRRTYIEIEKANEDQPPFNVEKTQDLPTTNSTPSLSQLQQLIQPTQQHFFTVCSNGFVLDVLPKNSVVYFEVTVQNTVSEGDIVIGLSPLFNNSKENISYFTGKIIPEEKKEKQPENPFKLDFDLTDFHHKNLIADFRNKARKSNTQIDINAEYGISFLFTEYIF